MRGDGPRNGDHSAGAAPACGAVPACEAVPDVFALLRRRALDAVADLIAGGTLPATLDIERCTVSPTWRGTPGDAVVDAGFASARNVAGLDGRRLAGELAARLAAAPEVGSAAAAGSGLVVLTLRRASLFAAAKATLRRCPAGPGSPSGAPPRAGRFGAVPDASASLPELRAAVAAEIRAAQAAAAGCAAGAASRPRLGLRPVVVGGRCPGSAPGRPPDSRAVLAWIGMDAFRFAVAACRNDAALRLDLDVLGDRSFADPAFSARYAHARARGVLRRAASLTPPIALGPVELAAADWSGLTDAGEVLLARLVAQHPRVAAGGSPQRLAAHLRGLAEAVHSQWSRSKEQPQLRFVNEEMRDLTEARLGLVTAAASVLRSGLDIFGIAAPDEMR